VNRVRIKICGITRLEDAERAVEFGADAIGFVLWPDSPRAVTPAMAGAISRALPAFVARVGVCVDMPPEETRRIILAAALTDLQLHGDEPLEPYLSIGVRVLRAVRLVDAGDLAAAQALPVDVTPLVDAGSADLRGGTGETADWSRARTLAGHRRIVLAGGLTPANVAAAIREVRPWAVDVASGVEASPGVKSVDRLRAFFEAVHRGGCDEETL
jgi:phosphoribosylanthranilate isomerase